MAPLIDPGYLTDPSDVTRVIEGCAPPGRSQPHVRSPRSATKSCSRAPDVDTDAACRAYLRSTITTFEPAHRRADHYVMTAHKRPDHRRDQAHAGTATPGAAKPRSGAFGERGGTR